MNVLSTNVHNIVGGGALVIRTLEKERIERASDPPEAKSWGRWHRFLAGVAVVAALGCNGPAKETPPQLPDANDTQGDTDSADTGQDTDTGQDAGSDSGVDAGDGDAGLDCSEPLQITNLQADVSPFGNEVTVSWETNRPASTWLAMWKPPDTAIWPVYYTEQTKDHLVKIGSSAGIVPEDDFAFYVSSEEISECGINDVNSETQEFHTQKPHLLIVLSPSYSDDIGIDGAISTYGAAIAYEDWISDVVKLDETTNDYGFIKELLADRKTNNNTPAAILVGEDLPFSLFTLALGADGTLIRRPLLADWFEIVKNTDPVYDEFEIVLSLLVPSPHSDVPPAELVAQSFYKFANNRSSDMADGVTLFYNDTMGWGYHSPSYPELSLLGPLTVETNAESQDMQALGGQTMGLFTFAGHGNPYCVLASSVSYAVCTYDIAGLNDGNIAPINVPFLVVSGCDTMSWASLPTETVPRENQYFGGLILGDTPIMAVVAGLPAIASETTSHGEYPVVPIPLPNFISRSIPRMAQGQSLAQAVYGATFFNFDVQLYGDPTFRYH